MRRSESVVAVVRASIPFCSGGLLQLLAAEGPQRSAIHKISEEQQQQSVKEVGRAGSMGLATSWLAASQAPELQSPEKSAPRGRASGIFQVKRFDVCLFATPWTLTRPPRAPPISVAPPRAAAPEVAPGTGG